MSEVDTAGVDPSVNTPAAEPASEPTGVDPNINTPAEPSEPVEPAAEPAVEPETVTLTKEEHDKLNKRIQDKDTFIRTQQSEIDKFKAKPAEPSLAEPPPVGTSLDGKPTLEQYDFDESKHAEALMDWKLDQRDAKHAVDVQAESEANVRQERINNFEQRASTFRATQADFDEVAKSPQVSDIYGKAPHLADIVESSEAGPEIAYYFGNNPDVAANIASMPPYKAAIEIGKLEAKVLTAPKPKNITQAPTPINPVGGGHDPAEKSEEDMSQAEYEAARGSGKLK